MSKQTNNNNDAVAVGIDVGSLHARVAVSSNDDVRIVSNTLGHRSTLTYITKEQDHIVMGDAAQRLLQKQKQKVEEHTIRALLLKQENDNDDDDYCDAFMSHLGSLASDATSSQPHELRVVVSVPVDASPEYTEALVQCTKQGMRNEIKQQQPKNKKLQKQNVLVGVTTDAAAVCVAHGLTDTNEHSNVAVLDWGASGMTLTYLQLLGSSRILTVMLTKREPSLSGNAFVETLAKHVASQFERKHRIPAGELWENYKARTKLLGACGVALGSMTTTTADRSSFHVTIDGLYEGMDCHVGISRPRWEMLTSSLLTKAKSALQEFWTAQKKPPQVLLQAGSGCLMPMVQQMVDKFLSEIGSNIYRGLSGIPPDEAVALGCACHANAAQATLTEKPMLAPALDDVPVSPIALGLKQQDDQDSTTETLIGLQTPLPAHVVHTFVCQPNKTYTLWQTTPTTKLVAKLEDLPVSSEVELLVELTEKGTLSLSVQGGEVVRL